MFQQLKKKVKYLRRKTEQTLEKVKEVQNLPRSKRKSALLGMATVFTIFGIGLLGSSLPAIAKDLPVPGSPSPGSNPNPKSLPTKQSEEITKGITGAAASICAMAVSSGSFVVGAACGLVVVYGILRVQELKK